MCCESCSDNRFKIIEKAKEAVLEQTNIDSSENEMKVLNTFLFRCWQMGWLKEFDNFISKGEINNIHNWKSVNDERYIYQITEECKYEIQIEKRYYSESYITKHIGSLYLIINNSELFSRGFLLTDKPISELLKKACEHSKIFFKK